MVNTLSWSLFLGKTNIRKHAHAEIRGGLEDDADAFGGVVRKPEHGSNLGIQNVEITHAKRAAKEPHSGGPQSLNSTLRHEEAELDAVVFVDEQHRLIFRRLVFLDDVGWHDFPLTVLG